MTRVTYCMLMVMGIQGRMIIFYYIGLQLYTGAYGLWRLYISYTVWSG